MPFLSTIHSTRLYIHEFLNSICVPHRGVRDDESRVYRSLGDDESRLSGIMLIEHIAFVGAEFGGVSK